MTGYLKNICIILFILVVFSTAGCDTDAYSAEKRFWRAARAYNQLVKDAEKASLVDYQRVIDSFREITIRYPMWPNSAQAQFYIGQLYAMQNNLLKARAELETVLKEYPENSEICANALFMIAMIYEKEENWPKAQEALNRITKDYQDSTTALQVPIYIAEHYKIKGQEAEAGAAYASAIDKYKQIVKENSKDYIALVATDFVIACYGDQEKWNEAVEYMNGLIRDYPDTLLAPKALFVIGAIYQDKLAQPEKALEYYGEIVKSYSKTFFAKLAQKQIELIKSKK